MQFIMFLHMWNKLWNKEIKNLITNCVNTNMLKIYEMAVFFNAVHDAKS